MSNWLIVIVSSVSAVVIVEVGTAVWKTAVNRAVARQLQKHDTERGRLYANGVEVQYTAGDAHRLLDAHLANTESSSSSSGLGEVVYPTITEGRTIRWP